MKKRIYFTLIVLSIFSVFVEVLFSVDHKIIIKGNISNLDFDDVISNKNDLTDLEIRMISTQIADYYLQNGYTGSKVVDIRVTKTGTIIFTVDQPKIMQVEVTGVSKKLKEIISRSIVGDNGIVYNEFILNEIKFKLQEKYKLSKIKTVRVSKKTNGLLVILKTRELSSGRFYASVATHSLYGVIPKVGYLVGFEESILNSAVSTGIATDKLRMVNVDSNYQFFLSSRSSILGGLEGSYTLDRFESMNVDYDLRYIKSHFGYKIYGSSLKYIFGINSKYIELKKYFNSNSEFYDISFFLDIDFSDRNKILNNRKVKSFKFNFQIGRQSFSDSNYIKSDLNFDIPIYPFVSEFFRVVPFVGIYYTSLNERFMWDYVFPGRIRGFQNNYTASSSINSGGVDFEFEISRDFFYLGTFVDGGYYLDESKVWDSALGSGMFFEMIYGKLKINLLYGLNLAEGISSGKISFNITGSL